MAEKRFNIVFSGKLAEGSKPPEVLQKLCAVLKLGEAEIREIFKPGAGAVICKDLDGGTAYSLLEKLKAAGVMCAVKEVEPPPPLKVPLSCTNPVKGPQTEQRRRPQDVRPSWQPPVMPQKERFGMFAVALKIILLAVIGYGGWWGYQTWFAPPSPAFTAYTTYAEAMAHEQYQKAADASQGEAKSYAESRTKMMSPQTIKVYGREYSTNPPSISSIAGDIAWIKRKRKSEEKKSDTVVELKVEQTVCRIPPGVASALCKWPVTFQQDIEVQLTEGVWKVSEFKESRLTPQDK